MICLITNIDYIIELRITFNKCQMCAGFKVSVDKTKAKCMVSLWDRLDSS